MTENPKKQKLITKSRLIAVLILGVVVAIFSVYFVYPYFVDRSAFRQNAQFAEEIRKMPVLVKLQNEYAHLNPSCSNNNPYNSQDCWIVAGAPAQATITMIQNLLQLDGQINILGCEAAVFETTPKGGCTLGSFRNKATVVFSIQPASEKVKEQLKDYPGSVSEVVLVPGDN